MSRRAGFILAMVALAIPAPAAVLYSTSFEDPPFTIGLIAGQDGWSVFGSGVSTVENALAKTGAQAVFVDGGTASQSGPYHTDTSTGPIIDLSADIAIFTSGTQSTWQFAGLGPGLAGYLGGIQILPNNNIVTITASPSVLGVFPRALQFDSTAWHHLDLLFNLTTQTYSVSLDSKTLASNVPFCGSNGSCNGAALPTYAVGFFDSFGGGNDAGYMDNYQVSTANAPSGTGMYHVTVDTSSLSANSGGSLDFNFNPGPLVTQSASVQILNFKSDTTPVGNCPCGTGDVNGQLPATLTIDNGTFFNDYFDVFASYGKTISFDVSFSGPALKAPAGVSVTRTGEINAPAGITSGSTLAFSLFSDYGGSMPVLTSDMTNGFAFTISVNLDGSTTVTNSSPQTSVVPMAGASGVSNVRKPGGPGESGRPH